MNMRYLFVTAAMLLLASCGETRAKTPDAKAIDPRAGDKPASSAAGSGEIRLPAGSSQLQQLKTEIVVDSQTPGNEVSAPARVEVNANRVSHMVLPVAGRITKVMVKLGDSVQQGEPVLALESSDNDAAVAAVQVANAAVAQAASVLTKANADLDRTRDLYEHKAIASKEVLNAESVVTQSKAALEQARVTEAQSLRRLEILGLKPGALGQQLTVAAPISGKITEINVVPGEFRNDLSAAVLTIADFRTVWISSDVAETDIRFVHEGQPVDIELTAFPGEKLRGTVTRIADMVDPQTRTVKVRAELDNSKGRFRPEMFGRVRLAGAAVKLPVVPSGAVLQREGSAIVYQQLSEGVFRLVRVTPGERVGDRIAIRSGLVAGDRVVTDGAMLLNAY